MWSPIWSLCWLFQFLPLTISPPAFDFETLYFIFTMLLWWQFDKIFSINWITLKADLKKKMCQPKKIGLSLSKSDSTFLLKNNFPSKSSLELIAVEFSFILCILSLSVTFWGCKRQDQAFWNFNNFPVFPETHCAFWAFWGCEWQAQWRWCSSAWCIRCTTPSAIGGRKMRETDEKRAKYRLTLAI